MTGEMPPQGLLTATGFAAREAAGRDVAFRGSEQVSTDAVFWREKTEFWQALTGCTAR